MGQRDNNQTKEQMTTEGHQWVLNAGRNSRMWRRSSANDVTVS